MPADAKRLLTDFANGQSGVTFEEIVAAFPALNAVPAYIHCGCAVAGAPAKYKKIAQEYADRVNSCASFASDAVNTFLDGAQSVGKSIHEALNGTPKVPGIQMEQTCYPPEVLPDGMWTRSRITVPPSNACNVIILTCAPGHVIVQKKNSSGNTLSACAASCPDPIHNFTPGGCYAQIDWKPVDGVCTQTPGMNTCCGDGSQVLTWGQCSPQCARSEYWDIKAGRCRVCAPGWFPVRDSPASSVGTCKECPSGQTYNAAANRCEPLNCAPLGAIDPKNTHVCDCGAHAVRGLDGRCQFCGAGHTVVNGMCMETPTFTAPQQICPPGTHLVNGHCLSITPPPATAPQLRPLNPNMQLTPHPGQTTRPQGLAPTAPTETTPQQTAPLLFPRITITPRQ